MIEVRGDDEQHGDDGPGDSRARLRADLRARRSRIEATDAPLRAAAVARRLASLPAWTGARAVGGYLAVGGELDCSVALADARRRGATTHLPVLAGDRLRFGPVDDTTELVPNRYRIGEPTGATVAADELDAVLVPAVAVDTAGNRLGMGAGWYDRTFAAVGRGTLLIALVHDEQVLDRVPAAPWDVPVQLIVTPTRTLVVGPVPTDGSGTIET